MEKIVVDSNIIFAALHSGNASVREKLSNPLFSFYAPKFLFVEIFKHKERLVNRSKANPEKILEFLFILLHYINFINEDYISTRIYIDAYNFCKDVDVNDTPFVALSMAFNCRIWTRDEALKSGLALKGFTNFIDEKEI
jgi:predicted nucleic acid-binding protein